MSPLLPNQGPPTAATHEPIPLPEMFRLRNALMQAAPDFRLTDAILESVAEAEEAPLEHVYAAAGTHPQFVFQPQNDVLLAVCTGGCQSQGAIENLKKFIETRKDRAQADGKKNFDIMPRACLDMCPHAPVVMSRGPHGTAAHPKLTPDGVNELIDALCDDA